MKKTFIIGYGNVDRQDDGVAWHILVRLAERLGREVPASPDDGFQPTGLNPEFLFVLQLTPELAEDLRDVDRAVFIDAHTGSVPGDIQTVPVKNEFQASPLTHHMTPGTLLALSEGLYGRTPAGLLVSVRGYAFGFSRSLSPPTAALVEPAADQVWNWLNT